MRTIYLLAHYTQHRNIPPPLNDATSGVDTTELTPEPTRLSLYKFNRHTEKDENVTHVLRSLVSHYPPPDVTSGIIKCRESLLLLFIYFYFIYLSFFIIKVYESVKIIPVLSFN